MKLTVEDTVNIVSVGAMIKNYAQQQTKRALIKLKPKAKLRLKPEKSEKLPKMHKKRKLILT